jgi:hypothetical protein
MKRGSGAPELDPIHEETCGNTTEDTEEFSVSEDEDDTPENAINVSNNRDNAVGDEDDASGNGGDVPENAGVDTEGEKMDVNESESEAEDDETYEHHKLIERVNKILQRRDSSRPGPIYDMEVELRLPFYMEKLRPKDRSPNESKMRKLVQGYVTKAWRREKCCDGLWILTSPRDKAHVESLKWKSDVKLSLPLSRFTQQILDVATLLEDRKRGRRRERQNAAAAAAFTRGKLIVRLTKRDTWKEGRFKESGDCFTEAYNLVREEWEKRGIWRRKWDGERFPSGPWMHQEHLDVVIREEMGYDNYKRFKKVTGEPLAKPRSSVSSISAAEQAAEEALNKEMSLISTSDDSDLDLDV